MRSVSEMKYYQLPKWWHLPIGRWNCSCMCSCTYARLYIISIRLCEVKCYQLPKWLHLVIELRAYSNAQDKKSKQLGTRLKACFEGLTPKLQSIASRPFSMYVYVAKHVVIISICILININKYTFVKAKRSNGSKAMLRRATFSKAMHSQ